MNMLGNAHAPKNHGTIRCCVKPCHFLNCFRWDAADGGHCFRTICGEISLKLLKTTCPASNKVGVYQPFLYDGVHHCVKHCHVHVRLELQRIGGVSGELGTPWIGNN